MKFSAILVIILFLYAFSASAFSAELKQRTGIIKEIRKDHIVLDNASGTQSHIGFVCDPEVCESTTEYRAGDEVLAIFGSAKRTDSAGRINKLISIRNCLDSDPECREVAEEAKKNKELREIELEKNMKLRLACRGRMYQDLKTDSRYIADTWVTRFRRLTIDRNVDLDGLDDNESAHQCVNTIFNDHTNAVIEICEKHGCGSGVGGGCAHIAGYSGTDALWVHATKQCSVD